MANGSDAATKAGVRRIVLLSGRGEPEAEDAEKALQATTLDWTIIRARWFFQNFSENYFLDDIRAGRRGRHICRSDVGHWPGCGAP
jgi:uncharacterized protein YbjT (DUF2867 family)